MNNTTTTTIDQDRQPTGAARVGMEMRLVRERLGWRLSDVAAELRIRLPYLEAIERGELSALPGAAYQTGFVRTYAQALGLDGEEILRRFRAEGTSFVQKAELSFLAPVPDRAVPTGAIVLLGVVLVLVGYGVWYRHTAQEAQLAAQIPPVPTELAPLAVPPKPPEATPPAKAAQASPSTPSIATQAAPAGATPPIAAAPEQTASAVTPAAAAPAPTPAPTPAPAAPVQKTIEATGDSWVQVQDAKGGILFSKTLHAGDTWPVPDLPGLIMTAGNAGNTLIADNGAKGPPLGADGTVIRKYALTAPAQGAAAQGGSDQGAPDSSTSPQAPATASPHAQLSKPAASQAASAAPIHTLPPPPMPSVFTPSSGPPLAAGSVEGPSPSGGSSTN